MKKPFLKVSEKRDIFLLATTVFVSAFACAYIIFDVGATSVASVGMGEATRVSGSLMGLTQKIETLF